MNAVKQFHCAHTIRQDLSDSEEEPQFQRDTDLVESDDAEDDIPYPGDYPRYRRTFTPHFSQGEFKAKLDIPYFDGRMHIEDYLDWEKAVENFFEYMEVPPDKQVRYVAYRLKGGASAWWAQLLQMRLREGKGTVRGWNRMRQLLRAQFLPTNYEQILYMRYQHCSQGGRSVSDYTEEFHRLSARNNLNESANHLVARYIGGLKDSIQDRLELNSVWSMAQAVNLAMKVDMHQTRQSKIPNARRHWQENVTSGKSNTPGIKPTTSVGSSAQVPSPNQTASDSRAPPKPKFTTKENPYAKPSTLKCFRCFHPGHKSNECPQRQQVHIVEGDEGVDQEVDESNQEGDSEDVPADEGEALVCVLEKLLLAPRQSTSPQRHSMFKTRCTIGSKVCDILIDNGCTENVILRAVVQSLQLKTIKNAHPYKISWVKRGVKILVSESCQVTFSIGKQYVCDVLCDVLDMDVCHLILGRPWQFDVGATYDCRANIYSFVWNGRRLRLLPTAIETKSRSPQHPRQTSVQIVSGAGLLYCWKEPAPLYALLVTEQSQRPLQHNLHRDIQSLLQQYQKITPDNLPAELLPIEDIVQADRHCRKCRPENSSGNRPGRSNLVLGKGRRSRSRFLSSDQYMYFSRPRHDRRAECQSSSTSGEYSPVAGADTLSQFATLVAQMMSETQSRVVTVRSDDIDRHLQMFLRSKPPRFEGAVEPRAAEEWLRRLEKTFDGMQCPADRKVSLAVFLLDGEAEHWWEGQQAARFQGRLNSLIT
ncbi:hypothetical protein KFK09_012995 [Dendrobium nobile]|uniref:CCHC-type domain-containing protein n=1 Tax=Dendrobium nobile TaxID=94219 RepID=A0A8T3BH25_DENNO|nr:hypothetical protein KFK09_012995 [Dendrobium nobile]